MFNKLKEDGRILLRPLTFLFQKIHPNFLTLIGFLITCVSAFFYARGIFWLGGIILLIGGLFDVLDGEVAKLTNKKSNFGAFLDSSLDRYSDFIIFFGMFIFYCRSAYFTPMVLILLSILGSYITSYTRARAEGISIECKVGLGERVMRLSIIILGSFFGPKIFIWFLWILAVFTNLTAFHRMYYVWGKTHNVSK